MEASTDAVLNREVGIQSVGGVRAPRTHSLVNRAQEVAL